MVSRQESLMQSSPSSYCPSSHSPSSHSPSSHSYANSWYNSPEIEKGNRNKVLLESPSPEGRRRKRSVRFNRVTYIQETSHVNDMTEEEIDSVWFSVSISILCKDLYFCISTKNGTDFINFRRSEP
jgi:hypothetical protein